MGWESHPTGGGGGRPAAGLAPRARPAPPPRASRMDLPADPGTGRNRDARRGLVGPLRLPVRVFRRPVGGRPDHGIGRRGVQRRSLKPLARIGVLTAAACVAVAGIFIPDLASPSVLNLFLSPDWVSPLIWESWSSSSASSSRSSTCGCSHAAGPRGGRGRCAVAYAGLPAAVLLHWTTAWIWACGSPAHGEHGAARPLFVVSAILSGTASLSSSRWRHTARPARRSRRRRGGARARSPPCLRSTCSSSAATT